MNDELRQRTVAAAVVYDEPSREYLLWHNKRWGGYAFPMKHFEPGDAGGPAQVVLDALAGREFPLDLPEATASPLDFVSECLFSDGVRRYTYYDYHVYGVNPGTDLVADALDPDLRFFTYEELLAAPNVTSSTKSIARSLVEDRKVAASLITRMAEQGREFLLAYEPTPIDTSLVELGGEILELTEKLAENAHDIWARQRISDGWEYGPRRDDDHKRHPCLVPYSELPESEKKYDRRAAMETLKAILALGFRIEKV